VSKFDDQASVHEEDDVEPGWPWSFILLVVAGAVYLLFRFVELFVKLL
jgi:hypothetical protein